MKLTIIFLALFTSFVCFGLTAKVKRIIDGDTFEIETGEKVRLIGINAPEISDIFGEEAKQHLSELIQNKTVDLQTDNISNDRDRYQRLLRYVFLNGVDINKKMVSDGFAFAYLKYHFSKSIDYKLAQIQSRDTNKGIWGDNKNVSINKVNEKKDVEKYFIYFTPKAYIIFSLVLMLLFLGIYSYFRK